MKRLILAAVITFSAISCKAQNPQPFPYNIRVPNAQMIPEATQIWAVDAGGTFGKINIADLTVEGGTSQPTPAQTLSLSGNNLEISGGNTVDLSRFTQSLSISGTQLSLSNGNSVTLPSSGSGTVQTLSIIGQQVSISGGNTITIPSGGTGSYTPPQIVNTTTNRNLSTNDIGNTIECTANSIVSIPLGFTQMTIGQTVNLEAHNGAELTIQAPAGVTINYVNAGSGKLSSRMQSVVFGILRKNGANSYIISGQ